MTCVGAAHPGASCRVCFGQAKPPLWESLCDFAAIFIGDFSCKFAALFGALGETRSTVLLRFSTVERAEVRKAA